MIPLSFLRRLDSLKYTSVVALISIGYLVILVVAHFVKGDTGRPHPDIRYFHWAGPVPALSSFPVIVFAYTCHQNVGVALRGARRPANRGRCSPYSTRSATTRWCGPQAWC